MVESQILANTFLFRNVYNLFSVNSDEELISKMTLISICTTIIVLISGRITQAPYGRYLKTTKFTLNAKFSWMLQESPAIFVPLYLYFQSPTIYVSSFPNICSIGFFSLHYFQRTFIYPFRVSNNAKPCPMWTVFSSTVFCFYNGFYQGHHLLNVSHVDAESYILWPGILLFLIGMSINIYHDEILINLSRNRKKDKNGSHSYEIPRGGLFEYVSGANYFGEIVEWWAIALITRQFPQIMFALFSTQFLGQRAIHHHKYYKQVFGNKYPSNRKAIIPFIL